MKTITLTTLFITLSLIGFCKTFTITNTGSTFTPNNLTVTQGDTVIFNIVKSHNAVEVSKNTWDNNQNTAIPGGFSLPFGGGTVLSSDLELGSHYYVCTPHAAFGMKGTITVNPKLPLLWTIGTPSGAAFSPNDITITEGDTVKFAIGGSHNAVEVSQSTWNNNQSTALNGGFSVGFGGGTLLPAKLPVGIHYYVCTPHAAFGMKGIIRVVAKTVSAVESDNFENTITIAPNPSSGIFKILLPQTSRENMLIEIYDFNTKLVLRKEISQSEEINISNVNQGIYVIKMIAASGIKYSKLIVE
jgi:plastocyanin